MEAQIVQQSYNFLKMQQTSANYIKAIHMGKNSVTSPTFQQHLLVSIHTQQLKDKKLQVRKKIC